MKDNNMMELKAWFNGYEVVAAYSPEEATEILLRGEPGGPEYDDREMAEGDGWQALNNSFICDEHTKQTVGEALKEKGSPGHLWCCEV